MYTSYLPKKGGVQMHIHDVCEGLKERGYTPIVFSWTPCAPRVDVVDGVSVKRVRVPRLFSAARYPSSLYLSLWALYFVKKYKIDVIHAHDYLPGLSAAVAGTLTRTPTLVTFHLPVQQTTFNPPTYLKPFKRIEGALLKCFNRWVSTIVCVSKFTLEETQKLKIPQSKLKLIYNWVDSPSQDYALNKRVLKELNLSDQPFILSAGRLFEKQKPFSLLIRAFKSLLDEGCNLDLVIVGNGPDKESYQKRIESLNIGNWAHILSGVSDVQLAALYDKCVLFVLPSYYEGLPLVLLEAMANGKPIVSTKVGGIPEVVQDGYNGVLVKPDAESLFLGLQQMLHESCPLDELGERSKKIIAERFSKKNLDDTISLFEELHYVHEATN
jgi:glycosyltransferase involved in cell wall biosynthesis